MEKRIVTTSSKSSSHTNATHGTKATFIPNYNCDHFQGSVLALSVDGSGIFVYSITDFRCLKSWLVPPATRFTTFPCFLPARGGGEIAIATECNKIAICSGQDPQICWISSGMNHQILSLSRVDDDNRLLLVVAKEKILLVSLSEGEKEHFKIIQEQDLPENHSSSNLIGISSQGFPLIFDEESRIATLVELRNSQDFNISSLQLPPHSIAKLEDDNLLIYQPQSQAEEAQKNSINLLYLQDFPDLSLKRLIPNEEKLSFFQPISSFFFLSVPESTTFPLKMQIRDLIYGLVLKEFDLSQEFGQISQVIAISNSSLALVSSSGAIWTLECRMNLHEISLSSLLGVQMKSSLPSRGESCSLSDEELIQGLQNESISTWNTPGLLERILSSTSLIELLFLEKTLFLTSQEIVTCLEHFSTEEKHDYALMLVQKHSFTQPEMSQALKRLSFAQIKKLFFMIIHAMEFPQSQQYNSQSLICFLECLINSHFVDFVLLLKAEHSNNEDDQVKRELSNELERLKCLIGQATRENEECLKTMAVVCNFMQPKSDARSGKIKIKKKANIPKAPYAVEEIVL